METSDFIKEVHFENTEELFHELSPFGKYKYVLKDYIFRGESSANYKLLPSVLREENKSKLYSLSGMGRVVDGQDEWEYWQQYYEVCALKRFFTLADERGITVPEISFMRNEVLNIFPYFSKMASEKWIPEEFLELAALAQHYGVPTRLIDWSLSHMISLYFAVSGALNKNQVDDENMVLWALNYREFEFRKITTSRIPLRLIKPNYNRNPNLLCQKGVLSCWEYENQLVKEPFRILEDKIIRVNRTPLDELISNYVLENDINLVLSDSSYTILLYKFYLPIKEARTLYEVLTDLNYGADSIFFGFNGVFQRMKDDARCAQ
ncbi:MAG TPA: hypothetical protein DEF42_02355 [Desulfosporosinus sp.]|nr:hypothetical protein [Desulfosporosinus sp.]